MVEAYQSQEPGSMKVLNVLKRMVFGLAFAGGVILLSPAILILLGISVYNKVFHWS